MSAPVTFRADGEANRYTVMQGDRWLASVLVNGELLSFEQENLLRRMAAGCNREFAEALLYEARSATRERDLAASHLARIRGYARQTAAMREDAMRWAKVLSEAEATLRRVLGGAA